MEVCAVSQLIIVYKLNQGLNHGLYVSFWLMWKCLSQKKVNSSDCKDRFDCTDSRQQQVKF